MPPTLDNVEQAHRFFAADCFNRTWALIDKADRTTEDDRRMLLLSLASLWHWTQRPDCTNRELSVGYWQVSRVYALLGQAENARQYAADCLKYSQGLSPFLLAYAHESLARAALAARDGDSLRQHRDAAQELAATIVDAEEKQALESDLASLRLP